MSDPQAEPSARDIKMLLNACDRHIAALEAEVDDIYAPYSQIPSENQLHMYVSNRRGIIQLDQDAAFVCLAVMLCGPANFNAGAVNVPMAATYVLSLRQDGPRKYLTFSRNKSALSTDNNITELNGAPSEMFVPVANAGGFEAPFRNADFFYTLAAEWLIPRGESFQALFPMEDLLGFNAAPADGGVISTRMNAFPKVVLVGRKVF